MTRRFALAAWLFLGIGILLGARWSYTELGWGGYWAWDAVENAALMPWLAATAFIHSIMIQEKRGMLKVWNVSLILGSGTLAILGTFLVRSGILDSIHAFGASTLGIPFVLLIAAMVIGSIGLVVRRRAQLRSDAQLDSLLSREAVFLFQNLVLVAMVFVIFWVTFFPLISEAVTGTKVSVGPPAFRPFIVPLALILVLLSGIGPIIAWRRVTVANLRRNFTFPALAGVVALVALALSTERRLAPVRADHVRARRVRGRDGRPGAVARDERAPGDDARSAAGRVRPADPAQPAPLRRLHRPRRARRAAHRRRRRRRRSSTRRTSTCGRARARNVDGYTVTYATCRPTSPTRRAAKISFGAVLDVSKNGHHVTTLKTTRRLLPGADRSDRRPDLRGVQRRSRTATSACAPGSRATSGRSSTRTCSRCSAEINQGDQVFAKLMTSLTPAQARQPQNLSVHPRRARAGDRRTHLAVRQPSVAGQLPADRLAARDLDLARRDHHRVRRPDRAVAGAGARAAAEPGVAGTHGAPPALPRCPRASRRSPTRGESVVEFVIVLVVLAVVVFVVTAPLRARPRRPGDSRRARRRPSGRLAELEAAREAKYREIRDAELDHRTGKLSDADFEALDRTLRAEAIEILHRIDRAGGDAPSASANGEAAEDARRSALRTELGPGSRDRYHRRAMTTILDIVQVVPVPSS